MNHDAILERLKKLLRMKRGGTPDEIATALRLAQQIADEHGINLDSLNPDEEGSSKMGTNLAHGSQGCPGRRSTRR